MDYNIELQRNNVTLTEFFSYIKSQCAKKGIDFGLYQDEFENPTNPYEFSYLVKDGIKYVHTSDGPFQKSDGSDAAAKAETLRLKPLDYQSYALFHDGSCYNEICEFAYDDEKRGYGYYYKAKTDAHEQQQEQQKAELGGAPVRCM